MRIGRIINKFIREDVNQWKTFPILARWLTNMFFIPIWAHRNRKRYLYKSINKISVKLYALNRVEGQGKQNLRKLL